jgi:hypothetical protein
LFALNGPTISTDIKTGHACLPEGHDLLQADRKLLGLLSRCFYQTLKQFLQEAYPERQAVPGMIVSIQTYGDDLLRFHPHLHCLVSDGLFLPDGSFLPVPAPEPEMVMRAFRHRLLKALLAREIITPQMVELLLSWRHAGFSAYQGEPVPPDDTAARERLARYILHAPFSQERMTYDRSAGTVACESRKKNGDPKTRRRHCFSGSRLACGPGHSYPRPRTAASALLRTLFQRLSGP